MYGEIVRTIILIYKIVHSFLQAN